MNQSTKNSMLGSGYFIFQECWPKQCFMQNSVVRDITFFSEKNNLHFGPGTIHKKLQWNFLRFQWHLWALLKFRSGRGDGRFDGWADGGLPAREGEVSSAIAPFLPRQLMTVDGSGNPAVDTILTSTSGEISKWVAGFVPHNCRLLVPSSCILESVFYVLVYYGR